TAAERLDEPDRNGAGLSRQLQHDLGQLDGYPVGIGEGGDLKIDGALQANYELGARCVALEGGLAAARWRRGARRRSRSQLLRQRRNRPADSPCGRSEEQPAQSTALRPAKAHVVDPRLTHYEWRDSHGITAEHGIFRVSERSSYESLSLRNRCPAHAC